MKGSVSLLFARPAEILLLDHALQPLVVVGLDSIVEFEQRIVEEFRRLEIVIELFVGLPDLFMIE